MHRRAPFTFAAMNILGVMTIGTFLFRYLEKWTYIESFYYTGMMITTIGTADPSPSSDITKILTVLFAMYAITVTLYCLGVIKPRMDEVLTSIFDKIIFWKKIG